MKSNCRDRLLEPELERLVVLGRGTEMWALHQHAGAAVPAQDGVVVPGRPERLGLRVPPHCAREADEGLLGASWSAGLELRPCEALLDDAARSSSGRTRT